MIRSHMQLAAAALMVLSVVPASASVITFTGEDTNVTGGGSHPNSDAAEASFASAAGALGAVSLITFENATLGSFTNLTVATGVTINGSDPLGNPQSILNSSNSPSIPTLDGSNVTSGGSAFVELKGGTLTFSFATPVDAFGAYLTGVQTYFFQDVVQFSDGTSETVSAPGTGTSSSVGAVDFVGFTDAGKSISSITINAGTLAASDYIGVDDVRYASSAAPEPGSLALVLTGGLGFVLWGRRRNLTRQ